VQLIALDDLNGGFQALFYAISEGLAGAAANDQQAANTLSTRSRLGLQRPIASKAPPRPVTSAVVIADGMGQPLQ
jgi:hypothetical protein